MFNERATSESDQSHRNRLNIIHQGLLRRQIVQNESRILRSLNRGILRVIITQIVTRHTINVVILRQCCKSEHVVVLE